MKEILLSNRGKALVDDEDFDFLSQWSWYQTRDGYAARSVWAGEPRKLSRIWMHRVILNLEGLEIADHVNRHRLDNRRSNLRSGTRRLNSLNNGKLLLLKDGQRWYFQIGKPAFTFGGFESKALAAAIGTFIKASMIYAEVQA